MKDETKKPSQEKEFDNVKTFRDIKDKISSEISKMNFEEIKAYLKANSTKFYKE